MEDDDLHGFKQRTARIVFFTQQRKLMGSSAQNSSGVRWCRRRVRFNEVPEKVPEKVWEALVQSQVRFNRVPEKVPERVPEKVPERVPEKVPGSLGAKPSQVQRGPEKVAETKPGQVHLTQVFPALGFPARFRKICKNKTFRLLGIPPRLIFFPTLLDFLVTTSRLVVGNYPTLPVGELSPYIII